jgi:hypothetical protein
MSPCGSTAGVYGWPLPSPAKGSGSDTGVEGRRSTSKASVTFKMESRESSEDAVDGWKT